MADDEDGRPGIRQDVSAGQDSYAAARDVIVNQATAPPAPAPLRAWGNVPARNPSFSGREERLATMRETLLSGNRAAVQALHGMGGIGKTQLAIEYVHRFSDDYDVVWWLDSENAVLFTQQYADLAAALGCAEPTARPDAVRRGVLSDLHHRRRWLLVFDNAEDPGALRDWLPSGHGHVLITSRSADWDELAVLVPVDVLPRPESVQLIRFRVPQVTAADAATLAEALGDLPLAIAQAAAYLAETRMPAAGYVSLLQDRAPELLGKRKPATYRATLTAVITLAYDRLRDTDGDAADLAAICAFLSPEPIPVTWFTTPDRLPATLRARMSDPLGCQDLLQVLTSTSLARLDADGLTMHRLTQAILRTHCEAADEVRGLAEAVITSNRPQDSEAAETWNDWARLLPHLLALDPARTRNGDLQSTAENAAWYLTVSGHARDALRLAIGLHQNWGDYLGPDHKHTLFVANVLGEAHRALGQYQQARQIDEDTLARRRRLFADDDLNTLVCANNLAIDLRALGDYSAARALDEGTLSRCRQTLGDSHIVTLRAASNLAIDLRRLGDHEAARALDEDALSRCRQILGDDHRTTLRTATCLALDLNALGDHRAARALNEDTLERSRRTLGDDHPETLICATNLADDLHALGDYQAARALNADTLDRFRLVVGENHPYTAQSAEALARDLRALGEPE